MFYVTITTFFCAIYVLAFFSGLQGYAGRRAPMCDAAYLPKIIPTEWSRQERGKCGQIPQRAAIWNGPGFYCRSALFFFRFCN